MSKVRILLVHRSTHGTDAAYGAELLSAIVKKDGRIPFSALEFDIDSKKYEYGRPTDDQLNEYVSKASIVLCFCTEDLFSGQSVYKEFLQIIDRRIPLYCLIEDSVELDDLPPVIQRSFHEKWTLGNTTSLAKALGQLWDKGLRKAVSEKLRLDRPKSQRRANALHDRTVVPLNRLHPDAIRSSLLAREILEQVMHFCEIRKVDLKSSKPFANIVKTESIKPIPILQCPDVYYPDDWSFALILALRKRPDLVRDKIVAEIGCGSGIVPICLSEFGIYPSRYLGLDIDHLAVRLCELNFALREVPDQFFVIGGSDMFEMEHELAAKAGLDADGQYLDTIIANVPQVPVLAPRSQPEFADYYQLNQTLIGTDRKYAKLGYQLLMEILVAAKERLREGGHVVLTVSGRCDPKHIHNVFNELGFEAESLVKAIVPHDSFTDLSSFQYFHSQDPSEYEFSFYKDSNGLVKCNIDNAMVEVRRGTQMYHDLYVFSAKRM